MNNFESDKKSIDFPFIFFLIFTGGIIYLLSPILTPFILAILLAYLGDPLVDKLDSIKIPRIVSVIIVFSILSLALLSLIIVLFPIIQNQILVLQDRVPQYLLWIKDNIPAEIEANLPKEALQIDMKELNAGFSLLWEAFSTSGMAVVSWIVNIFLVPVLTFYLLLDWDNLISKLKLLLPQKTAKTWIRLATESDNMLSAFLRGQILVMLCLGVIYSIGLWIIGLDFALLIGVIAGLVSFVPYLGFISGIAIASVVAYFQFLGFSEIPFIVLVFLLGQLIEGIFLTPKLVGDRIGLHPVAVIFAIMAGGQLYGFFGILLALPAAAVIAVLLRFAIDKYQKNEVT